MAKPPHQPNTEAFVRRMARAFKNLQPIANAWNASDLGKAARNLEQVVNPATRDPVTNGANADAPAAKAGGPPPEGKRKPKGLHARSQNYLDEIRAVWRPGITCSEVLLAIPANSRLHDKTRRTKDFWYSRVLVEKEPNRKKSPKDGSQSHS
jgi:hypothetical protein